MTCAFEYNGTRSTTYGVILSTRPEIRAPKDDSEIVKIPGRGELTVVKGGFADIQMEMEAYIQDVRRLPEVVAWLQADGHFHPLTLSYDSTRYRLARIDGEITAEHVARALMAWKITIPMRVKPYRYAAGDVTLTLEAGTTSVRNPGSVDALPLITLEGTGAMTFTAGGRTLTISNFATVADAITVDCDAKIAWYTPTESETGETVIGTRFTGGDWPVIPPGTSNIVITGSGITSVTVSPRWRWLG